MVFGHRFGPQADLGLVRAGVVSSRVFLGTSSGKASRGGGSTALGGDKFGFCFTEPVEGLVGLFCFRPGSPPGLDSLGASGLTAGDSMGSEMISVGPAGVVLGRNVPGA